jgi:hypothetical protein
MVGLVPVMFFVAQVGPASGHDEESAAPPSIEQFVGSTPCDALPQRFLGILNSPACERITWQLTLSKNRQAGHPRRYNLQAIYGMQMQGAAGFVSGGTAVQLRGTWSLVNGSKTNPDVLVYRIRAEEPARSMEFAKMGDNLLHLLNEDKSLMIGNASWSYTLNRAGGAPNSHTQRLFEADVSERATVAGIFEGRSPCQAIARQLNAGMTSDCTKLKWRLTLLAESSGRPASYKLEGTLYRDAPRTGKLTILREPRTKAVIYRLNPDQPAGVLSLFKADDNILFFLDERGAFLTGDVYYSYTLNRIAGSS